MTISCDDNLALELKKRFRENPSIENYLALRESDDGIKEGLGRFGSRGTYFVRDELRASRIPIELVLEVMVGDTDAVDQLSLELLRRLASRQAMEKSGETHLQRRKLAVSDELIDYLVVIMLESIILSCNRLEESLFILLRERLTGSNPALYRKTIKRQRRLDAAMAWLRLANVGEKPSIRTLAKRFNTAPSSVSRWFAGRSIEEELNELRSPF